MEDKLAPPYPLPAKPTESLLSSRLQMKGRRKKKLQAPFSYLSVHGSPAPSSSGCQRKNVSAICTFRIPRRTGIAACPLLGYKPDRQECLSYAPHAKTKRRGAMSSTPLTRSRHCPSCWPTRLADGLELEVF